MRHEERIAKLLEGAVQRMMPASQPGGAPSIDRVWRLAEEFGAYHLLGPLLGKFGVDRLAMCSDEQLREIAVCLKRGAIDVSIPSICVMATGSGKTGSFFQALSRMQRSQQT